MTTIPGEGTDLLTGVHRVLFCHAHPDDETLSTGALIAHLVARGASCDVLTATRGEAGELVPGVFEPSAGGPSLAEYRAGELQRALDVLGVAEHFWLGHEPARAAGREPREYRDSGMQWVTPTQAGPADATDERGFSVAAFDEELDDLLALLAAREYDLVVSYDANGGYGHPDHVRMHELSLAACRQLGLRFAEVRRDRGEGVQWLELDETLPVVAEALRQHATQLTVQPSGAEVVHVGGQAEPIFTSYGLRLVD